jgi:hypothetical protein
VRRSRRTDGHNEIAATNIAKQKLERSHFVAA